MTDNTGFDVDQNEDAGWRKKKPGVIEVTKERWANPCAGCKGHMHGKAIKSICCNVFEIPAPGWPNHPRYVCFDTLMLMLTRSKLFKAHTSYSKGKPSSLVRNWSVLVYEPCDHLQSNGQCGVYEKRPAVCAEYQPFPIKGEVYDEVPGFCERYEQGSDLSKYPDDSETFSDPWELAAFAKQHFGYDYLQEQKLASKVSVRTPAVKIVDKLR